MPATRRSEDHYSEYIKTSKKKITATKIKDPIKMGNRNAQTFIRARNTNGQLIHLETWSTTLAIRELKIKTMLRCYLTPERLAIIKKSSNNKCWWGWGVKGTLLHCWWECKQYSHCGNQYGNFSNNKNRNFIQSSSFQVSIFPKELKIILQRYMHTHVYSSTPQNSSIFEELISPSIDTCVNKMWCL